MPWALSTLFSPPKQCWVSEGITLTGTILKGYSQSGGQEPP